MQAFLNSLATSNSIKILLIVIILDTIFGILRAIREKKVNSAIGIDGIIRKGGMILSVFFFKLIDFILNINLIAFLPESAKNFLNVDSIGITFLFIILFIVFEFLSVLKNMIKCKMPIPKNQKNIKDEEIVGGHNPYKLDNGMYVNDGDIREVK